MERVIVTEILTSIKVSDQPKKKHKKQSFIAIWQLQQWLVSKGFFNPE